MPTTSNRFNVSNGMDFFRVWVRGSLDLSDQSIDMYTRRYVDSYDSVIHIKESV